MVDELSAPASRWSRRALLIHSARVTIGVLLLAFLILRTDVDSLVLALATCRWELVLLSTALFFGNQFIVTWRWRAILGDRGGPSVPFLLLFHWGMIGCFVNMFMPSVVGGDVMRIYRLSRFTGSPCGALSTVIMERGIGLLCLVAISVVTFPFFTPARMDAQIYIGVAVVSGFFTCAVLLSASEAVRRGTVGLLRHVGIADRWSERFDAVVASYHALIHDRRAVVITCMLTLVTQVVFVILSWLLGEALGLGVPLAYYFIAIPMILLLTTLPVSVHGVGIRESAFVFFFAPVGVSVESAIVMSLLRFSQMMMLGVFGGLFFLCDPIATRVISHKPA